MFIAIPSELKSKVKEISLAHPRLQAMTLDTGCKTLLVINVYFPQDSKTVNYKVNEDLEDILASINIDIDIDYTHEFELDDHTFTCTIDHFVCNYDFLINVKNAGVIHFPENTSDHSPIYCETSETYSDKKIDCDEKITKPPVNLKRMTDEDWSNFNTILDTKLEGIIIPDCVSCRDVHCKNPNHIAEMDEYALNILGAMDDIVKQIAEKNDEMRRSLK